jgi:hypothetical protein
VVGAQNVGKTTFIKFFEKTLKQYEIQETKFVENRSRSSSSHSINLGRKYIFKATKKFRVHKLKLNNLQKNGETEFPLNQMNFIDSPGYTLLNQKEWIEMILKYINDSVIN